ncbi:MAG: CsbD family protein [Pseudomonadales bacterium]
MNKDQVKGLAKKAKGKVKEAAGKLVGNDRLKAKGKIDQIAGKVQAGYGDMKNDLKKK